MSWWSFFTKELAHHSPSIWKTGRWYARQSSRLGGMLGVWGWQWGTHVVRMEGGVEDPTKMVNSCGFPNFAIPNFGLIGGSLLKNLSSQISLPRNWWFQDSLVVIYFSTSIWEDFHVEFAENSCLGAWNSPPKKPLCSIFFSVRTAKNMEQNKI